MLNSPGKGLYSGTWIARVASCVQLYVPSGQREVKAAALDSGVNLFLDFSRTSMSFAQVTILCIYSPVPINYKPNVSIYRGLEEVKPP